LNLSALALVATLLTGCTAGPAHAQSQSPSSGGIPPSITTPDEEAGADGSTTIYFGPQQPAGVQRGNWIQTMPGKGWFTILRLYSPLEPFFDKSWRPSEIELVQ
jgi:hypothetical protein